MKIKIKVPTGLADIKLSQYQKFLKTTEGSEDAEWINKQLVGIFCNVPDDIVKKIYKRDYNKLIKTISAMVQEEGEFTPVIEHKGKEYGFIPDLDKITVGETADIDSMIGDWSKMHKVMAILYRPIVSVRKGKYLIEDYTGEEEPLDLPMNVVQGALVFFYNLMNDLLSCTRSFIKAEAVKPKTLQILEQSGVGIKTFMQSVEATFSGLTMLQNYPYIRL